MVTADPALTGTLSGFLAADGVTAIYSRTAGETVAGRSVHDQRGAESGGRAEQLQYHLQHGELHDPRSAASVTPNAASKTYGDRGPGVDRHAERVPGGGWRDGDLQPHGGRDGAGGPYTISAVLSPAGVLEQLQHHLQHGQLHDHDEAGVGDAECGDQDVWDRGSGVHRHAESGSWRRTA